ncbi:unnamed protein product [Withania somnifera]
MCSQFNSSSSSSLMVLPKCNFLSSRPILDFQDGFQNSPTQNTQEAHLIAQNHEDDRQQESQQQQQDIDKKEEEELFEDNAKDNSTKTIPPSPERVSTRQMMICPPAPKKKTTIQVTKRKYHEERAFLDVYHEVESLFPPALLADLGNKIKKARK